MGEIKREVEGGAIKSLGQANKGFSPFAASEDNGVPCNNKPALKWLREAG